MEIINVHFIRCQSFQACPHNAMQSFLERASPGEKAGAFVDMANCFAAETEPSNTSDCPFHVTARRVKFMDVVGFDDREELRDRAACGVAACSFGDGTARHAYYDFDHVED